MTTIVCSVSDIDTPDVLAYLRSHSCPYVITGHHDGSDLDRLGIIHRVACLTFGVEPEAARRHGRRREHVEVRQAVAQFASVFGIPFRAIGPFYGREGHSAMVCAAKRCRELIQTDPAYRAKYRTFAQCLQGGAKSYQQDINHTLNGQGG